MGLLVDIAIYLPSLRGGGAERAMVTLANGFAERGYKVDLVLATAEGPYLTEVLSSIRVIDLKSKGVLRSLPGLITYLRKKKPKVMLSAMTHANVITLLASKLSNVQTQIIVSERNSIIATQARKKSLSDYVIWFLANHTYRWADAITVVANAMKQEVLEACNVSECKVHTIYNPVVTDAVLNRAIEEPDHVWLKDAHVPVILGIGRLTEQKDFPTLINAFSKVKNNIEARLIILGEGEDRNKLESLVRDLRLEDCVSLPGFKENPFCYMRKSTLFVLSSRWEGLPNVLIQAMACGAPVVSTNCPTGPDEILENGRWGKLVPVGDIQQLSKAIYETLTAERTNSQSRANEFSVKQAVDGYLSLMSFQGHTQ